MSVASKLPSIITKKIFRYAYTFDEDHFSFVRGLHLSAVCKQWREDALPLICSCAFINFSSTLREEIDKKGKETLVGLFTHSSNIDFIKHFNLMHLATSVKFNISSLQTPLGVFLGALSKLLGIDSTCWSNVKSINLDSIEIDLPDYNFTHAQVIEKFSNGLYKSMPNVMNMAIDSKAQAGVDAIFRSIVNKYAFEQNPSLSAVNNKPSNNTLLSSNEHFKVDLYRAPCNQKAKSCQYIFSSLTLYYENTTLKWIDHILKQSLEQIHGKSEYPHLKELYLCFDDDSNEENLFIDNRDVTLNLPGLEKLSIIGPSHKAWLDILLNKHCFWPNLKYLELKFGHYRDTDVVELGSISGFGNLASSIKDTMPQLESVTIDSSAANIEDEGLYNTILVGLGNRVVSFACSSSQRLNANVFSTCLTYLKINPSSESGLAMVSANINTLQTLCLENINYGFDWAKLQIKESGVIRFPALKYLNITFQRGLDRSNPAETVAVYSASQSKPKVAVEFAMLSELCIEECSCLGVWIVMAQHTVKAYNTRHLKLSGDFGDEHYDSDFKEMLVDIGQTIVKSMPYVMHLSLSNLSSYENSMLEVLCQCYSKQLVSTKMQSNVSLGNMHFSPNLKKCTHIKPFSTYISETPKISGDNLDELYLRVNQSIFSWSWFAKSNKGDGCVTFKNMDSFCLELTVDDDLIDQADNIPESNNEGDHLDKMPLVCISKAKTVSFIANRFISKFSPFKLNLGDVYHIHLNGPANMLPMLDNSNGSNISITNDQCIIINKARKRDEDYFYMLTNSWLGSNHCLGSSRLIICDLEFELDGDQTSWNYVDAIDFSSHHNMSTIVKVLPKLSNLPKLAVRGLNIDDSMKETLENLDSMAVTPLSQSIERLYLEMFNRQTDNELAVKALIYFLLACPSLKEVTTRGFNYQEDRLVESYGKEYPHIAEIKFYIF